jgi:hypothetical protein
MKFWRLENNDGIGVYHHVTNDGENIGKELADSFSHFNKRNHPMPYKDSLFLSNFLKKVGQSKQTKFIFGFDSPRQLLNWFYDEHLLLTIGNKGIFVSVYESDNIIKGNTQAAIPKSEQNLKHLIIRMNMVKFLECFGS